MRRLRMRRLKRDPAKVEKCSFTNVSKNSMFSMPNLVLH